ncbi:MAG: serine/threonine-protein kinase [Wenzhouxiangella sp.]|jgi:serine/threonine-protein kinase|nr:serine/threonine-protein kinase [Wenzhouxiangella sp.]
MIDKPRGRLTAARRRALDRAFAELLDLPTDERDRRLANRLARSPRVGAWLQRLVRALAQTEDDLQAPLGRVADELASSSRPPSNVLPPGTRLGPWMVVEPVGSGGMGMVFKVERADGSFEMTAAAKLIRMRRDSRLEVRLAIERQLLARLDHPNIARIIDGGTTADGQPYLVMEWVPGEDLAERADQLSHEQRLARFCDIAAAVAHAHQRSVVHGDIKPANVRLGQDGRIRLLDFGVARLVLDEPEEDQEMIGALTPRFAAPEQLAGESASTQSDVWALGALLGWLLLGDRFSRATLDSSSALGAAMAGRVPRPGDLAAIIARACAASPEDRYAGVSEFIEDLRRHRQLLPVTARPPKRRYLIDRFIRRNPLAVSLSALSVLLLIAGLAGVVWQARVAGLERDRAERQRDLAELEAAKTQRVSEFVVGLFDQADPYLSPGSELTARDLLDQGLERIESLTEAPAVQAEMVQVLARVNRSLARHDIAHELSTRALDLLRRQPAATPSDLAEAWSLQGATLASLGRYEDAEQAHRRALELTPEEDRLAVARRLNSLGLANYSLGRMGEAETLIETALAIREAEIPESAETAASLNNLALVLAAQDRRQEAEPLYRAALDIRRRVLGDRHPITSYSLTNLATLLVRLDRSQEAEATYREALQLRREIFGENHPAVASVLYQIGWLQSRLGQLEAAREHLEQALSIRRRVLGQQHPSTAVVLNAASVVARDLGELEQAEQWLVEALGIYQTVYGDSHHDIALVLANLGRTLLLAGRFSEAERLLLQALEMNRRELGSDHRHVADNLRALAEVALALDQGERAAAFISSAVEVLDRTGLPENHPDRRVLERLQARIAEPEAAARF